MRRLITFVAAAALTAPLFAAEPISHERPIRGAENRQKNVTAMTVNTAKDLRNLIDEYQINGVGSDAQVNALNKLSVALERMADPAADAAERNMPWVTSKLANARQVTELGAIREELLAAGQGQDAIIKNLDDLIKNTKKQFGASAFDRDFKDMIKQQEKIKSDTEKQGDKTIGKEESDLNKEEKADNEKIANQQEALQKNLESTLGDLKNQDQDELSPEQKKALDDALKELQKQGIEDKMKQAAEDVANNQLNAAQEKQQDVLDQLKKAQNKLDSAANDPLDKLEQDLAKLGDLINRQEQNMNDTGEKKDPSQKDFNDLQAKQANINADTKDLMDRMQDDQQPEERDQLDSAAKHMDQAEKDLGAQQQKAAVDDMKKALDQMNKSQKQMQDRLDRMQMERMNDMKRSPLEQDMAKLDQMLQQEEMLRDQAAEMKQDSSQKDFAEMQKRQQQLREQMKDFQQMDKQQLDKVGKHLDEAEKQLGQMQQKPALDAMDKAIDEMKQMKGDMQDQHEQAMAMNPSTETPPKADPNAKREQSAQRYQAGKGPERRAAWKAGLAPSERDALQDSEKEKFPQRYEDQLTQYYKNLAGGEAQK